MPNANPFVLKLMQSGLLTAEDHDVLVDVSAGARLVKADTVLMEEGERPQGTPIIMDGFACRYRSLRDGRRQILGILIPGDCCDIQGAILGRSEHGTATLTDSEIIWLSRETVDDLTLARSRIARAMWWATLVDECILRSWLTSTGQRDAANGLAHFFCELLLRLQAVGRADDNSCSMPLRQEVLADILGLTSVHVSRTCTELSKRDLAHIQRRQLLVPDVRALRAFCDFDPTYLHMHMNGRTTD